RDLDVAEPVVDRRFADRPEDPVDEAAGEQVTDDADDDRAERDQRAPPLADEVERGELQLGAQHRGALYSESAAERAGPERKALSRILIFAEAVTLAHVARPIALARILRDLGHDVAIAAAPAADRWLAQEPLARVRIESIAPRRFLRALARGVPPYDTATLVRYVEDDLAAIAQVNPDVVVGDFRLSLYVSARRAKKPYGAIANAYWSRRYFPGVDAPDVAPLAWLPRSIADGVFRAVYPAAFALHALPFHRACRRFGVEPPGLDIRDVYTASDATAFADVEAFYGQAAAAP